MAGVLSCQVEFPLSAAQVSGRAFSPAPARCCSAAWVRAVDVFLSGFLGEGFGLALVSFLMSCLAESVTGLFPGSVVVESAAGLSARRVGGFEMVFAPA